MLFLNAKEIVEFLGMWTSIVHGEREKIHALFAPKV